MALTKEERAARLEKKKDEHYTLRNEIYYLRDKVSRLGKRKHSPAYKVVVSALDMLNNQVEQDYNRYVRRLRVADATEAAQELQQSLNREKKKNAELEKKIEEAKTSSGLFIDFVREKLNLK